MSPPVVLLLCLAAAVVGALLASGLIAARRRAAANRADAGPSVPAAAVTAAELSGRSFVFVGEHDDVLAATAAARDSGLARGSRIGSTEVLELVRRARRDRAQVSEVVHATRSGRGPQAEVIASAADEGMVIVVTRDQRAEALIDEARRDFAINISHELKTPIGAISLLSEAIDAAADDPEQVTRFTQRLRLESSRLAELVSQIIRVSQLQSADPLVQAEPVVVSEVVSAAVDRLATRAKSRKVNLTVSDQLAGRVTGDAEQLTDAVSNLIANAIAYSDEGARVAVTTRRTQDGDDDVVDITVTDNGIGIAEDQQQLIFDRFYRVDPDRSRASGGTGLGLSIVSLVAQAHGGEVVVWSKPMQGSSFTMRLPARLEDGDALTVRKDQE